MGITDFAPHVCFIPFFCVFSSPWGVGLVQIGMLDLLHMYSLVRAMGQVRYIQSSPWGFALELQTSIGTNPIPPVFFLATTHAASQCASVQDKAYFLWSDRRDDEWYTGGAYKILLPGVQARILAKNLISNI